MATERESNNPTPRGGVRSTAYYSDNEGNPVDETVATRMEVIEYNKDGEEIFRTYLEREPSRKARR